MKEEGLDFYLLRKRIDDEVDVPLFNESYVRVAHFHFSNNMENLCEQLKFSEDNRDDLYHYLWKPERVGYYCKKVDKLYSDKIKYGLDKMSALAVALTPFANNDESHTHYSMGDMLTHIKYNIDNFCVELASLNNKLSSCINEDTSYYIVSWC